MVPAENETVTPSGAITCQMVRLLDGSSDVESGGGIGTDVCASAGAISGVAAGFGAGIGAGVISCAGGGSGWGSDAVAGASFGFATGFVMATALLLFSLLAADLSSVLVLALVPFSLWSLASVLVVVRHRLWPPLMVLGVPCGPWERASVVVMARIQLGVPASAVLPLPSRMSSGLPPA